MDCGSMTRTAVIRLNPGLGLDKLPHQLPIAGGQVLVVAPGRAPLCLRCERTGHIRRDCRVPKCQSCHRIGHDAAHCVKTYAAATGRSRSSMCTPSMKRGALLPRLGGWGPEGCLQNLRDFFTIFFEHNPFYGDNAGTLESLEEFFLTSVKEVVLREDSTDGVQCADSRLREAGAEVVYCLARGAPKGPNLPRARLNHQDALFPGHGKATHSQTWAGEPAWLGVRGDATLQTPAFTGAPCGVRRKQDREKLKPLGSTNSRRACEHAGSHASPSLMQSRPNTLQQKAQTDNTHGTDERRTDEQRPCRVMLRRWRAGKQAQDRPWQAPFLT
ncbi:hypothetical protein ISCGN_029638 [Ixodes scapularis]